MRIFTSFIAVLLGFLFLFACAPKDEVNPIRYDLYLLIGQSNMAGRGVLDEPPTASHERVLMLGKDGTWVLASDPLHFDKPKYVGVGPGLSFGKVMAAQDKGHIIGLVPAAVGGSAIAFWTPGEYHEQTKTYPYDDAIKRTRIAMKNGTLKGIIWHQGESDAHQGKVDVYEEALVRLIKNLRIDLGAPEVPFIVGGMADYLAVKQPETVTLTKILANTPNHVPYTAFVPATGLTHNGDGVHFGSESARVLGRRYAEKLIQLRGQTTKK